MGRERAGDDVTPGQRYDRLTDVRCEWCDVWLAKATHIVSSVFCSAPCLAYWSENRRKVRLDV